MSESRTRVAVVTGAGRGIGRAVADRLRDDGYEVLYADIDAEAAAAAAADCERAAALYLDVRDISSVEECLAFAIGRWGQVHVWVNNAARTAAAPFFEIELPEWDDVVATNLRGTYLGCRIAGAHMATRGSGRIVNLASLAAQWGRSPTGTHYAASKAGIIAVTRFAAAALASSGVTVNAVAPGPIDGPSIAAIAAETISAYTAQIPVGRLGTPDEVAALIAFLASEASGFITGATYDINGGMLMR